MLDWTPELYSSQSSSRRPAAGLASLISLALVVGGCREPTQIELKLTTDAECVDGEDIGITVATPDQVEWEAPDTNTQCVQGEVGSLVLVPAEADDAAVGIKVVLGVGADFTACQPPDYALPGVGHGCIVARRALQFVPHQSLELPIFLSRACLGHPCTADSSCVDGICRHRWHSGEEDCSEGSCGEDDLPPCEVTHTCVGDANDDQVINVLDVTVVRDAMGTACGEPGFDPRADVTHDLRVDDADRDLVGDRFGCACPAACPGDADGNGFVDVNDLNDFGSEPFPAVCGEPGSNYDGRLDFDGSSVVDDHDLHLLNLYFHCSCEDLCGCVREHPCPGDVSGDGQPNGYDIDLFNAAYGTTCGEPGYMPTADFNSDNVVDDSDQATLLDALMEGDCQPQTTPNR